MDVKMSPQRYVAGEQPRCKVSDSEVLERTVKKFRAWQWPGYEEIPEEKGISMKRDSRRIKNQVAALKEEWHSSHDKAKYEEAEVLEASRL